jgi:hypothetical protein
VAVDKIWSKNGIQLGQRASAVGHAEAAGFYGSIAKLSPNTEAQHFIRKRALEISGAIRQTRALMVEQINSSIPWPFLTVLVFWISMLFVGFGLFARANATVIVALLIALCPKAPRHSHAVSAGKAKTARQSDQLAAIFLARKAALNRARSRIRPTGNRNSFLLALQCVGGVKIVCLRWR